MVRNTENRGSETEGMGSESKSNLEAKLDGLFKLPLAEFIGARNDLASRLKRARRADEANLVKALGKPSGSAWVINQLYWYHRQVFDELLAAGRRVGEAQASRT